MLHYIHFLILLIAVHVPYFVHLIDQLMRKGEDVICLDNFLIDNKKNIQQWQNHPNFELIRHDITEPILLEADKIWHLACPASPVHYQHNPIKTAKTSFLGTLNMLLLYHVYILEGKFHLQ